MPDRTPQFLMFGERIIPTRYIDTIRATRLPKGERACVVIDLAGVYNEAVPDYLEELWPTYDEAMDRLLDIALVLGAANATDTRQGRRNEEPD